MEARRWASLAVLTILFISGAAADDVGAKGCHPSCGTCQGGMSGSKMCLSCKDPNAPLKPLPGQKFGPCGNCDPGPLQLNPRARVAIPVRFQLAGPSSGTRKAKKTSCLVRGTKAGVNTHLMSLGECFDARQLHAPADTWLLDTEGFMQWRKDSGTLMGKCPQRRNCVAAHTDGTVKVFELCAEALKQRWGVQWTYRDGLLRSRSIPGKCLDVKLPDKTSGLPAKAVLVDCVPTPSANLKSGAGSVRYTDGVSGQRGGKVRWLQCISDCEDPHRFPPNGRCYVGGPLKAWGTCMAPHTVKPSLTSLEAKYRKTQLKMGKKLAAQQTRLGLLYRRCVKGNKIPPGKKLTSRKTTAICQAAGTSNPSAAEATCKSAGCKWSKDLEMCYFMKKDIPCEVASSSKSCSLLGHCSYTRDAAGRLFCVSSAEKVREKAVFKEAKLAEKQMDKDEKADVTAAELLVKANVARTGGKGGVEELMLRAKERASRAARITGTPRVTHIANQGSPGSVVILAAEAQGKPRTYAKGDNVGGVMMMDSMANQRPSTIQQLAEAAGPERSNAAHGTAYFKMLPDIRRPGGTGCATTCTHGGLVCHGASKCVVPRRECVKLCTHTDRRVILQARKAGEAPRLAQVQATCKTDRAALCTDQGSGEHCKYFKPPTRCSRLKVLWQDRPGTEGGWELNSNGGEAWISMPNADGLKCPAVGGFADFCHDVNAME